MGRNAADRSGTLAPAARFLSRVSQATINPEMGVVRRSHQVMLPISRQVPTSLERMTEDLPKLRQAVMLLAGEDKFYGPTD